MRWLGSGVGSSASAFRWLAQTLTCPGAPSSTLAPHATRLPRGSAPAATTFASGGALHPAPPSTHHALVTQFPILCGSFGRVPGACPQRLLPSRAIAVAPDAPLRGRHGAIDSGGEAIGSNASSSGAGHGPAVAGRRPATNRRESSHYDAVVVGLGAFGSAVLYHLAKAGLKVVGVERQRPVGHSLGSSHGASRIIRLAYFEGLQYGPLLKRSLRLFLELQDELAAVQGPLAEPLFLRTGMLDVGSVFPAALKSARVHGLQHEVLTGEQLNRRFPAYRVPEHWRALYQPDGGVLAPERIVQAHVSLAQRLGAEVVTGQAVVSWRAEGDSPSAPLTLRLAPLRQGHPGAAGSSGGGGHHGRSGLGGDTSSGAAEAAAAVGGGEEVPADAPRTITAAAAVLAPGPWIGQLVPELRELCVPERQVVGWFDIEASARRHFAPDRFPVFVLEEAPGGAAYYGFPEHGELPGFKIGLYRHLREEIRDPSALDRVRRTADAADEAALRAGVSSYFPAAAGGRLLSASACFFTNTPDGHFLVDRHPRHPQVVLCSACSGHGFKMSSGIGQLIARMVLAGPNAAAVAPEPTPAPAPEPAPAPVPAPEPASPQPGGTPGPHGLDGGGGGGGGGWGELRPFRFSPGQRPGHQEAMARFLH